MRCYGPPPRKRGGGGEQLRAIPGTRCSGSAEANQKGGGGGEKERKRTCKSRRSWQSRDSSPRLLQRGGRKEKKEKKEKKALVEIRGKPPGLKHLVRFPSTLA